MMSGNKKIALIFSVLLLLNFCRCTSATGKGDGHSIALSQAAPFKFGAAVDPSLLEKNIKYKDVVIKEFNSITPENCMKMNRLSGEEQGKYTWTEADKLIAFTLKTGKRVHGHTLVWHRALPKWVERFEGTQPEWDSLLKRYITDVVGHFKGRVHSWDVVNEAFEEDGSFRKSVWFNKLGEKYIEKAFLYAHEADPDALLFYNDFGQENSPLKRKAIKAFLLKLKNKGIPVHGVGLQMHTHIFKKNKDIQEALMAMSQTGLLVHISELTITVNPDRTNRNFRQNASSMKKQMNKFAEIIKEFKANVPVDKRFGITVWNVGDADSYFPKQCNCKDYPQLFDYSYNKKEYFDLVISALEEK